jgi:hypothetical protein
MARSLDSVEAEMRVARDGSQKAIAETDPAIISYKDKTKDDKSAVMQAAFTIDTRKANLLSSHEHNKATNQLKYLISIPPGLSPTSAHSPVTSTLDPEADPVTPLTPHSGSGGADPFAKVLGKAPPCLADSNTRYVVAPSVAVQAGLHGHAYPWDNLLDTVSSCSYVYGPQGMSPGTVFAQQQAFQKHMKYMYLAN